MLKKRHFNTSLTTPQAATPRHSVPATGPKRPTEPPRKCPIQTADPVLASPRIWLTDIQSNRTDDVSVARMTDDFSRIDRGIYPPVESRKASSSSVYESPAEPSTLACCVRKTSAGRIKNKTQKPASGFEGKTSCRQIIDIKKVSVFPSLRELRSQGGDPIRTLAHSKDPRPSTLSQKQPITEADNLDVRPWAPATHDMDAVCVGPKRGNRFATDREPLEEVADNPNTGCVGPILSDTQPAMIGLDENVSNDSGAAISPAPELLSSVWVSGTPGIKAEAMLSHNGSYWLYGDGFWGGSRAHPRTRDLQQDEPIQ